MDGYGESDSGAHLRVIQGSDESGYPFREIMDGYRKSRHDAESVQRLFVRR